ncbi:MAG: deoxyribodipyrimidine photolyase [Deltaproteobacteria bacterium]|nr:deoxyribodipyrimidine photolyase [Deltaproteobacteria bacterium]
MIAARRTRYSFALQHAVQRASELNCGLVVLEALRCDYPWASDRFHGFVVDGMRDNARALAPTGARYLPYLEPEPKAARGLIAALARHAALVVTDDFPCFFLPRMVAAAARQLDVRLEQVDGNGLYPLRATERLFTTAASFRRHLQKELLPHLVAFPAADPLAGVALAQCQLPAEIAARWPAADLAQRDLLSRLPIDHRVARCAMPGGANAATQRLRAFVESRLADYPEARNHPDLDGQSGLSPYLHFGHLSAHEVFNEVMDHVGWSLDRISPKASGSRNGWWGASPAAEALIDQLVTWRELGFNRCAHDENYAAYEALPPWALQTLAKHRDDPRPRLYDRAAFEHAQTADPLWNAAQRQLRQEGSIHNYLRMLWGKKILHWSPSPQDALATMIELNNKYALDGRNPNSYGGIFWVLGRFDRAWGPERAVFGKVRYMSSENTARKIKLKRYLERFAQ